MSERNPTNRFAWLQDEEDPRVEEALREDGGATRRPERSAPEYPLAREAANDPGAAHGPAGSQAGTWSGASATVPGRSRPKRRNRRKDPKALRNDPQRTMAGARIRRDVRKRVEQALADPEVGEGTNYSLLVESLLIRWLEDVDYPMQER